MEAGSVRLQSAPKRVTKRAFPQQGRIRRALLFILGAIVLGIGCYGLAGFFGGPKLVDRWLAQYRAAAPGRIASTETVRFNPFTLVAEVVALETLDENAGAALSADRLVVDLAARSLIELRPVVSSIVIERPRVTLASLADLVVLGRRLRGTALQNLRVDRIELVSGSLTAGLQTGPIDFARFDLSLTGFDRRSSAAGRFSLDAMTASGAAIAGDGSLAADLDRANGELRFTGMDLSRVASQLGGTIGAVEPHGRVDLSAAFTATSLLTSPALELADANLQLAELSLSPAMSLTVTAPEGVAAVADLVFAAAEDGLDISGRAAFDDARLAVHDARAMPPQTFALDDTTVLMSVDPDNDGLSLSLDGRLDGAGEATLTVSVPPGAMPERRVSMEAATLPATALSAYALDSLGRELTAGDAAVGLEYSLNGNRVDGLLRIVARDLAFGERTTTDPSSVGSPPLELAAALLESSDGIIELDVPFASNTGAVRDAAAAALKARLATITEAPFEILASLIDGTVETISSVPFLPGDAALNERALVTVARLADALNARPRLSIRVHRSYDPIVDRNALAKRQIELHVQLATAGPGAGAQPAPVDFGSARARDVLDEFAGERLPTERVADLAARFDCEGALVQQCERTYYEQIFDLLVANEEIAATALNRLGRFRAQSVADALRRHGIADERVEIAADETAVSTPFGVGLPLELAAASSEPWAAGAPEPFVRGQQ